MQLRERLVARGFSEARTSALVGRSSLGKGFSREAVELRNPLSEDHVALRPSLLPGLLATLERNLRGGAKSIRLFEVGRVFLAPHGEEVRRLGLLLCGEAKGQAHWRNGNARQLDLYDLKGALGRLARRVTLRQTKSEEFALATEIFLGVQRCGRGGQLSSAQANVSTPVFVAEIDLPNEFSGAMGGRKFRELQRFPSISRDIAMIAPEALSHAEVRAVIEEHTSRSWPRLSYSTSSAGRRRRTLGRDENPSRIH
jgi:phenylalanyl-tRNA synthetase beta chain